MSEVRIPPAAAPSGVKVLHGRDGYLFLSGDANRVMDQVEGRYPFSEDLRGRIYRVQLARRRLLQQMGVPYVHVIAPNKETVLEQQLPPDIVPRREGPTPIEHYRDTYRDVPYFEPDLLRGGAWPTYYRLDTHWTTYGASLYLLAALRASIVPGLDVAAMLARLTSATKLRKGDLGAKVGPEREEVVEFASPRKTESARYFNDVRNNGAVRLFRNLDALHANRVLFLHDSFGVWMSDMALELFEEAVFVHTPNLDPGFVEAHAFDAVVFVQAERFFVRCPSNDVSYRAFVEDLEQAQLSRTTFDAFLDLLGPRPGGRAAFPAERPGPAG